MVRDTDEKEQALPRPFRIRLAAWVTFAVDKS